MRRHRAREFRILLNGVENNLPAGLDIDAAMDNASSRKTDPIRDRFAKRPHWHGRFTPAFPSWVDRVERLFALLTGTADRARRSPLDRRTRRRHRAIYRDLQPRSNIGPLNRIRRRHRGLHRPLLPKYPQGSSDS